jgi:hypothetical protein
VVRLGLIKPPRLCFTLVKSLVKNDDSQCKTAEAGFPFFFAKLRAQKCTAEHGNRGSNSAEHRKPRCYTAD